VTRILDAGGEIVGKAVCEHLCFSGGSHTSDTGPGSIRTTRRDGSAALVVAGECDMAIGGDQGGSIRIPSSFCGAVSHKPTYGLVPYTGVFPIELTLDHTGPIARTAADAARFLRCLPGPMASTRANRRDCVRKPILSSSPETPAACGSESLRKGLAGPIPSPMSTAWCARRRSA
jgi:Asp-tRNA(Asn)/Glu-tRNA(Gln) amidotransferase A subunit family amidase